MLLTMSLCVDIIVDTTCLQFRFFHKLDLSLGSIFVFFFCFAKRSLRIKADQYD